MGLICARCGGDLPFSANSNRIYCNKCRLELKRERAQRYANEHKEQQRLYQRERYKWLQSKGFCIRCGSEKAQVGKVRCEACERREAEQRAKRKALRVDSTQGIGSFDTYSISD